MDLAGGGIAMPVALLMTLMDACVGSYVLFKYDLLYQSSDFKMQITFRLLFFF